MRRFPLISTPISRHLVLILSRGKHYALRKTTRRQPRQRPAIYRSKTEEGKRRSSLNARRHNLTGQVTAMTEEDRIAHNAFSEALIKSMAPEGALELQLAQRIATDSWRLNRSSAIEDNIFALGFTDHAGDIDTDHPELHAALTAARTFTREAKSIELLTLYEQRLNRSLQKNLALLQQPPGRPQSRAQSRNGKKPASSSSPAK